jgi:uncharacterized protein
MSGRNIYSLIGVVSVLWAINAQAQTIDLKAEPFALTDVRLLDSPFKAAQEVDGKYILSLDADRLLHDFRVNAGLPSSAQPLGGWESPNCELRGHFVGHYLSACALMYASTGDARFKERADLIVEELGKCQRALGGGYLSAFPESFFDRLEAGQKVWAPYYTIHKIMAGLLDVNQLCGNAEALEIDNGMATYFKHRIDQLSDDQMQKVMRTEFGGMMEVLANLSAVTGDADQLALAKRFDHHAVFDPLAAKEDKLARLHANTQIPKMTGAARIYELTGDMRYHDVPDFFWETVTEHHSFVTGSNSFGEMFRAPDVEASDLVTNTAETCNTYNMLKLTRHLFEWEPQAQYMDFYEKALYNHILGSIDPESGMTLYYLSLHPGHFKVYCTPTESFWCCTGTGVENHAKYGDTIYFHKGDALWVNLFIPSELQWKDKGITVRQETKFPEEGKTTLTIKTGTPEKLAINLRIPSWTSDATVKINGEAQTIQLDPGSYATIEREWKDGDKIELTVPMALHLYHPKDVADSVAILDGPIVLAGELGTDGMPASDQGGDQTKFSKAPSPSVPTLAPNTTDPSAWLQPVDGKPLTFNTGASAKPNAVELMPLYELHHQRYTVYWKMEGE